MFAIFSDCSKVDGILKVPSTMATPYNAQATLHFYDAFWALYLPVTVHGRVSDIWRSYFAHPLFRTLGLSLGFLPRPLVVQERNPHSYLADFDAEIPLYKKSGALANLVTRILKIDQSKSFPDAMESLWIEFYERGFIKKEDVIHVQNWLQALLDIGYEFPKLSSKAPSNQIEETYDQNEFIGGITSHDQFQEHFKDIKHFKCDAPKFHVKYGISDVHVGTRSLLTSQISHIQENVTLLGLFGKFENYPKINRLPGVSVYEKLSNTLQAYDDHTTQLKEDFLTENHEFYKNDPNVNSINAFVCSFPASMCQIWMKFEQARIVYIPAHRYNLGRCHVDSWTLLNQQITNLAKNQQNAIAAVSRYDAEYLRYYTGLSATLIPSYSGYYLNQIYNPDKPKKKNYLIFTLFKKVAPFIENVKSALEKANLQAEFVYDEYVSYKAEDLIKHPAIISLPYSVMSLRTTELYSMGIPMFFPSLKFFQNFTDPWSKLWGMGWDRTMTSAPYCTTCRGYTYDPDLEIKMRPSIDLKYSSHVYSPNLDMAEEPEAEMYWLQFADFYDWPHIQYFDDYDHLKELLLTADLKKIHQNMMEELKLRKIQVTREWCDVTKRILQT